MNGASVWVRAVALTAASVCVVAQAQNVSSRGSKAANPASSASAPGSIYEQRADEGRDKNDLTYGPIYFPRRVELTSAEIAAVRDAAVKQVVAFHESQREANAAAAGKHRLWLARQTDADASDSWHRLHTQDVLASQHFYSQVIFWVVLLIVGVALALTVYQFIRDSALAERAALRLLGRPKGRGAAHDASTPKPAIPPDPELIKALASLAAHTPDPNASAVEVWKLLRSQHSASLSPSGLQLGSQVVGLVVLVFALAFFYLYLEKVYPITVASAGSPAVAASAASTASAASK